MPSSIRYEIIIDNLVYEHFDAIDKKDHSYILDIIELQLLYEANIETRNRKPLQIPNMLNATWELRCGTNNRYRIFYDIDQYNSIVIVLAVGRKVGNQLWIGKERIEL